MGGAQPDGFREVPQTGRALRVPLDQPANAANELGLRTPAPVARPAALARAESGPLGHFRAQKQNDLFFPGTPRRTGRPAVNARGAYGIDECAIHSRVMRCDCLEKFFS